MMRFIIRYTIIFVTNYSILNRFFDDQSLFHLVILTSNLTWCQTLAILDTRVANFRYYCLTKFLGVITDKNLNS